MEERTMRNRKSNVIIIISLSLIFISSLAYCQNIPTKSILEVGFGLVDISGDSAIILDPIHVKAIVLRQGAEEIALVECDVLEISNEMTIPARQIASLKTGIPYNNICVAVTHTHMSSPHKNIQNAVIQAISDGKANLQPVKLKSGLGQQFNISFNRRYFMKDGSVVFNPMFLNPYIVRPAGPIDPEIGIVMFYDAVSNKPLSGIINFALHLDIVKEYGTVFQKTGTGSRNSVSADYPYWIETALRKDFGNAFNSIFLTGCCGNINHWDFSKPGPQSGHKTKSKQVGDSLYNSIKQALPLAKEETPSLASRTRVINVPLQSFTPKDLTWAKSVKSSSLSGKSEEPSERIQFLDNVKRRRILWLAEQKQKGIVSLPIDVQVFRLSNNTAIVTLPGEMFVEYGLTIKNFSPFENTIIIELANNGVSYVPNKKAFSQGGYEIEDSRLAPGGGEMLAEAAIQMLKELKNDVQ
jgi:neutral ceramidase